MLEPTNFTVKPAMSLALWRGLRFRCPACGIGTIFRRYVQVHELCANCGLEFPLYRSDDAPAYFTIVIVGHLIVPSVLILEQTMHPATWIHLVSWLPLTLLLTLLILPRVKGALLGMQWILRIKS